MILLNGKNGQITRHNGKYVLAEFAFLNIQNIFCFELVENGRRKTLRQLGLIIICYAPWKMNKEEIKLHVEQVFSGNTAPENYTNRDHCPECAEHDETLRSYTPKSIGLEQLGNPGWDPICFPTDYKQGEAGHIEDSHEKSEILLKITKPNGVDVILRDGYLGYFDPGNVPLKSNRRITRRMQGTACSRPDPDGF